MLVLTRRIGESLTIGNPSSITLTVLGIRGNNIRIGIEAPKEIAIHREEVFDRIKSEGDKTEEAA